MKLLRSDLVLPDSCEKSEILTYVNVLQEVTKYLRATFAITETKFANKSRNIVGCLP